MLITLGLPAEHAATLEEAYPQVGGRLAPPDDIRRVRRTGDSAAITLHAYGADLNSGTNVRRTYEQWHDR